MRLPQYPIKRQSLEQWCHQLVDYLRAERIASVTGARMTQTPNGKVIHVARQTTPTQAATIPPLILVHADGDDVGVTVGYVNGIVPTLGGDLLSADPAPTITITSATDIAVWILITATFGSPDTYEITIDSGATVPDPTITAYGYTSAWLLGYAKLTDGNVVINRVYLGGNMQSDSFGTIVHWWKI